MSLDTVNNIVDITTLTNVQNDLVNMLGAGPPMCKAGSTATPTPTPDVACTGAGLTCYQCYFDITSAYAQSAAAKTAFDAWNKKLVDDPAKWPGLQACATLPEEQVGMVIDFPISTDNTVAFKAWCGTEAPKEYSAPTICKTGSTSDPKVADVPCPGNAPPPCQRCWLDTTKETAQSAEAKNAFTTWENSLQAEAGGKFPGVQACVTVPEGKDGIFANFPKNDPPVSQVYAWCGTKAPVPFTPAPGPTPKPDDGDAGVTLKTVTSVVATIMVMHMV